MLIPCIFFHSCIIVLVLPFSDQSGSIDIHYFLTTVPSTSLIIALLLIKITQWIVHLPLYFFLLKVFNSLFHSYYKFCSSSKFAIAGTFRIFILVSTNSRQRSMLALRRLFIRTFLIQMVCSFSISSCFSGRSSEFFTSWSLLTNSFAFLPVSWFALYALSAFRRFGFLLQFSHLFAQHVLSSVCKSFKCSVQIKFCSFSCIK